MIEPIHEYEEQQIKGDGPIFQSYLESIFFIDALS